MIGIFKSSRGYSQLVRNGTGSKINYGRDIALATTNKLVTTKADNMSICFFPSSRDENHA